MINKEELFLKGQYHPSMEVSSAKSKLILGKIHNNFMFFFPDDNVNDQYKEKTTTKKMKKRKCK